MNTIIGILVLCGKPLLVARTQLLIESLVVVTVTVFTLLTSGILIARLAKPYALSDDGEEGEKARNRVLEKDEEDTGRIVGKCENILIILFFVADALTAMALIFTAKTIVRKDNMQKNPRYYIVGTMLNVTYSIIMGISVRIILSILRGESRLF